MNIDKFFPWCPVCFSRSLFSLTKAVKFDSQLLALVELCNESKRTKSCISLANRLGVDEEPSRKTIRRRLKSTWKIKESRLHSPIIMAMPHSFVKDQARSDSITSESVSLSDMGDDFFNQHGRDHVSAMLAYAENEPSSEHSLEHSRERAQDPIVGANRILPFNLATCVRPNILALQPYRCARE